MIEFSDNEYWCECEYCQMYNHRFRSCPNKVEESGGICKICRLHEEYYTKVRLADELATEEAEDILRVDPRSEWDYDDSE